eukprot:3198695-Pyramimonas_sp.AAC.2
MQPDTLGGCRELSRASAPRTNSGGLRRWAARKRRPSAGRARICDGTVGRCTVALRGLGGTCAPGRQPLSGQPAMDWQRRRARRRSRTMLGSATPRRLRGRRHAGRAVGRTRMRTWPW